MNSENNRKNNKRPPKEGLIQQLDRLIQQLDRLILRFWKLFTSLKFGIFLLALIGVVAIWGTMGFASNAALGNNSIPMARTLVFENPWFVALLLLFSINLLISTWPVTQLVWKIWGRKEFRRDPSYFQRDTAHCVEMSFPGGPDEAQQAISPRFRRLHRDGNAFFAQKGILSRLGPTVIHIGILLVIGAMVAKSMLLWNGRIITEGRFVAAEGEEFSTIQQPAALEQQINISNRRETPIGVWVKVLDFDEVQYPNSNIPAHFRSLIEVRDPKTQIVTVAQLDMNHSLGIETEEFGTLQFHQAGYQPVGDNEVQRMNFDVRDSATGERIAVTDATPDTRVRIGETDHFLEVTGIQPGNRWNIFHREDPYTSIAEGLLSGGQNIQFSIKLLEFYANFRINPDTKQPENGGNQPSNPALNIAIYLDGQQVQTSWLFYNKELAELMPELHPRYTLTFDDIRIRPGEQLETINWNEPNAAIFDLKVADKNGTDTEKPFSLTIQEKSKPISYTASVDHKGMDRGTENDFEVRVLGPTQRFITVLSVVNEPTVPWIKLGVLLMVIGSIMTFSIRYRSFYALWDESRQVLLMTMVPRRGQSAVKEELDALAVKLKSTNKNST